MLHFPYDWWLDFPLLKIEVFFYLISHGKFTNVTYMSYFFARQISIIFPYFPKNRWLRAPEPFPPPGPCQAAITKGEFLGSSSTHQDRANVLLVLCPRTAGVSQYNSAIYHHSYIYIINIIYIYNVIYILYILYIYVCVAIILYLYNSIHIVDTYI